MIDPRALALTIGENALLQVPRSERTGTKLREVADFAAGVAASVGTVDPEELVARLEERFDVWVPRPVVVNAQEHEPWYPDRREKIKFGYWDRYRTWLGSNAGWKPAPVEALDQATDLVLERLEDPERPGSWASYGLVYGQVQSGKTANYTGVICKAVDAGYRVVIVLAGRNESLRNQTQARLDLEFLGFNTRVTRVRAEGAGLGDIGVGTLGLNPPVQVIPLTTTESDFRRTVAQTTAVDLRKNRVLIVVKKYKSILDNLAGWLENFVDDEALAELPMLLIDDEADDASIDTRKAPDDKTHSDATHDPTAINRSIRTLLSMFDRRAYLAYTATPFGNIFIPHATDHPELGPDLFPRNFILALKPPSNYCGPERVFGFDDPWDEEVRQPLPIVRQVQDHDAWMPDGHRNGHRPAAAIPVSLVEAVDAFVLATAVRRQRAHLAGATPGHNSMLVHVTRWTATQAAVVDQLSRHLAAMRDTWGDHGQAGRDLRVRLRRLWQNDMTPVHRELAARDDLADGVGAPVTMAEAFALVPEVLTEAAENVKAINGTAQDVLDYRSSPVTVVAVGGDKLSRGLTLEGLTVSYYLRASNAYDTLLQMGRWFGYRPGYLDVTRLYTTRDLTDYYVHITRANRELMDVVTTVAENHATPREVGLKIEDGIGRLQVTAAAKRRAATTLTFTFSGERPETLYMLTDPASMNSNLRQMHGLVEAIRTCDQLPADAEPVKNAYVRTNVSSGVVRDFLIGFSASPRNVQATPTFLVEYLDAQSAKGELTTWTVALVAGNAETSDAVDDMVLPRVTRRPTSKPYEPGKTYEVGVLVNPTDEAIGLTRAQFAQALKETRTAADDESVRRPSGRALRRVRPTDHGLLVVYRVDPGTDREEDLNVGFAISFPQTDNARKMRYKANDVFIKNLARSLRAQELGLPEDDTE